MFLLDESPTSLSLNRACHNMGKNSILCAACSDIPAICQSCSDYLHDFFLLQSKQEGQRKHPVVVIQVLQKTTAAC